MKAVLVRVGIDSSVKSGEWNAPVNPDTGEFAYVPVLEDESNGKKKRRPAYEVSYEQFKAPCQKLGRELPPRFDDECAHLDPDFEYLTYGDEGEKAAQLKNLGEGDILAFYAGLKPTKPCQHKLIYALIGLYVLEKPGVPALDISQEDWHKNAHTRRECKEDDIVFFGKRGASGRLKQCICIGEWRDGAYRVRKDLLDMWGGLSIRNGFIQRSARIPYICSPTEFRKWFKRHSIRLVARQQD